MKKATLLKLETIRRARIASYAHILNDVRVVGYPSDSDHAARVKQTRKHYNLTEE